MRKNPAKGAKHWNQIETPIGFYGIVSGDNGLVEILSAASGKTLLDRVKARYPNIRRSEEGELEDAAAQMMDYFTGRRRAFSLRLDLAGLSPFTIETLNNLQGVPFGETVTYGQLATLGGRPRAARAVGRIMATNPFPLVIPCHRVLGANGRMTGYSGGEGIKTKQWLLRFEDSGLNRMIGK